MNACLNCGRPYDADRFPLARPRKDGRRHPFRYCDACLALPSRNGGGHEAARRAALEGQRRYRLARLRARQRAAA